MAQWSVRLYPHIPHLSPILLTANRMNTVASVADCEFAFETFTQFIPPSTRTSENPEATRFALPETDPLYTERVRAIETVIDIISRTTPMRRDVEDYVSPLYIFQPYLY